MGFFVGASTSEMSLHETFKNYSENPMQAQIPSSTKKNTEALTEMLNVNSTRLVVSIK